VEISHGSRPGEPRIDHNHFRVAGALRFDGPFEPARMILGRITAHD